MSPLAVTLTVLAVIFASVTILWLASLALRNSSIVDIYWGTGFVVANWFAFGLGTEGYLPRKLLLGILVTLWGLRLTGYILWRNWGKEEDFRYRKWREEAGGSWWWKSLFKVFLLQGALQAIVAAPLIVAQTLPGVAHLTFFDLAAAGLWLLGFVFETAGDWQLARFRADPSNRGKLLQSGVWRYTRHPNYFGDAAQWWAFYMMAAATGAGAATIFSPILMTFLLVRVSGVGLLEKTLRDKKPGYREYMETTSAFIPWFPKRPSPQGRQQGA